VGNKVLNEDYVILSEIGKGSGGKVKLAFHTPKSRFVAIKVVRRARTTLLGRVSGPSSIEQEIQLMTALRHKHVVSLFEVIDDPALDKLYLIMQYVDEGPLATAVGPPAAAVSPTDGRTRYEPHYSAPQVITLFRQVFSGLEFLHDQGVAHRDIKPENLLRSSNGQIFVADFGVSMVDDDKECAGSVAGTPLFMAPESLRVLRGGGSGGSSGVAAGSRCMSYFEQAKSCDMWSVGISLLTLLTGRLPFGSIDDILRATQSDVTQLIAEVEVSGMAGDVLKRFLGSLLSVDPTLRPDACEGNKILRGILNLTKRSTDVSDRIPDYMMTIQRPSLPLADAPRDAGIVSAPTSPAQELNSQKLNPRHRGVLHRFS
jgi:serine/threonine protein kinase